MFSLGKSFFEKLDFNSAEELNGFSLVPMVGDVEMVSYLLLSEAVKTGKFVITEVSRNGTVPFLEAENMLNEKVLLLLSEEIVGGKQNRVFNVDILVPEKSRIEIPVSCVEQGRWSRRTDVFEDSGRKIDFNVKAEMISELATSRKARSKYRPSQSGVWQSVDESLCFLEVDSDTRAAYDAYLAKKDELEQFFEGIKPLKDQVGVAVFFKGNLLGIDYLAPAEKFAAYFRKILSSYLLVSLRLLERKFELVEEGKDLEELYRDPEEFSLVKSPGLGQNLYASWKKFAAQGLVFEDDLLHLSVVRKAEKGREEPFINIDDILII
jgi:hypothetical protein